MIENKNYLFFYWNKMLKKYGLKCFKNNISD